MYKNIGDLAISHLPTEVIKVRELAKYDCYKKYNSFSFCIDKKQLDEKYNHGLNFQITNYDQSMTYLHPNEDLVIIKRGVFDLEALKKHIDDDLAAAEELKILDEEEEQRQLEEEKLRLTERLRKLNAR